MKFILSIASHANSPEEAVKLARHALDMSIAENGLRSATVGYVEGSASCVWQEMDDSDYAAMPEIVESV